MMFKERVLAYIKEHTMIRPGDVVCVACSGGADSIALLTVLHMLCKEGALTCGLSACHLNHRLRGAESDADQAYVEAFCAARGIPLYARAEDVAALAAGPSPGREVLTGQSAEDPQAQSTARLREDAQVQGAARLQEDAQVRGAARLQKGPQAQGAARLREAVRGTAQSVAEQHIAGLEAAGRAAREALFNDCIREHGVTKIALAHHMDDQAETVLFHLARGAALAGLSGMWPVRGDRIRPLLCVSRREIEAWLTEQGIAWRTDASNLSDVYTRNRLRHRILPQLETQIHAGAARHIAETAETLRLADAWMRQETERKAAELLTERQASYHLQEALSGEPELLQRYLIMHVLELLAGTRADFSGGHVQQVKQLLEGSAGRQQKLPHGITAIRTCDGIRLTREAPKSDAEELRQGAETQGEAGVLQTLRPVPVPAGTGLPAAVSFAGYRFSCAYADGCPHPIPEKTYTKWLNCDMMGSGLVIRTRRPGDYIVINEAGDRQSLKAWMINRKIPRQVRDQVPLLTAGDGSEVFWIVGGRISARARITEKTRQILYIIAEPPVEAGICPVPSE